MVESLNSFPKIYIAGHKGMIGAAIVRQLLLGGYPSSRIITRTHADLDLTNQVAVKDFFVVEKPDQVYLAAAKVGGIFANNTFPANFIYDNLMIESNVINAAFCNNVRKLLFLGSSCIYPKFANQPMSENILLTGVLEPTNEPYAIAKIAGIKLCESYNRQYGASHKIDYRSVMPTNLYGPGDNYHPDNSHVIPALIYRFHEAKSDNLSNVIVWGSGTARREFLYVDDMAAACVHIMNIEKTKYEQYTTPTLSHLNVGCGHEITIEELAKLIAKVVGYCGQIIFDQEKPDGVPRKLIDSSKINALGWSSKINLEEGLMLTYNDFLQYIN